MTRLWDGRLGVLIAQGQRFSLLEMSKPPLDAYPAYISTCTDVLSSLPRENRSGRKFDHIFPSTAEFKNDGSHTSTPPIHLDVADGENYFFYLVLYGKTVPAGAVGPLVKRTVIGICAFLSTNL